MSDKNVPAQREDAEQQTAAQPMVWDEEEHAWAVPGSEWVWDPAAGAWRGRAPRLRTKGPQGAIGVDGYAMAKVAAVTTALGGEHTHVLKIMSTLQEIALQAIVSGQPVILNEISRLVGQMLNTMMQDVRNMRATVMPRNQGFLGRLSGVVDQATLIEYVAKQDVLNIMAGYNGKLPHHTS